MNGLIEDANGKIIRSIKRVLKYARDNGVRTIIQYGDIADKPELSYDAQRVLYSLFLSKACKEFDFHFIPGNHDFAETGIHSLTILETISKLTTKNIKVYSSMEEVELEGRRFNMMPHPFTEFKRESLNVAHLELKGSFRDNGRMVDHGLKTKHAAVIGHLHTCHRIKRAHFSGTLYQTNFGESLPKSFHHVKYEDDDPYSIEVTNVPFEPPWKLINLEIETESDLSQIEEDPDTLYKLFVKEGLDLDLMDVMRDHPNVVRHNKFKNKKELKELIEEEWEFEQGSLADGASDRELVTEYLMTKQKLSESEVKRGFKRLNKLLGNTV